MHFAVQSPHPTRKPSSPAGFPSVLPPPTPSSSYLHQLWQIATDSNINVLLLLLPFVLFPVASSPTATFVTSLLVIMPLANALGTLTEDIARSQPTALATLINVTFGSATEFIINIALMRAGEFDLIQYSLLGSVLSNMLLDLGMSMVIYGLRPNSPNKFNVASVRVYSSVLMLTSFAFFVPMAVVAVHPDVDVVDMSRQFALVLCVMYFAFLVFQLRTHADMFSAWDDAEYGSRFSLSVCFACMAVLACLISVASNAFVSNIETTTQHWHLTRHFIGVILLPIAGNAPEHVSTTVQAYKGNLDISFGIAIGSSIQISCFVVPLLVLMAWLMGQPLSMNFHPFSTIMMFVSVIVLNQNLRTTTGTCHWLNGVLLLGSYIMLCIAFLHVRDGVL